MNLLLLFACVSSSPVGDTAEVDACAGIPDMELSPYSYDELLPVLSDGDELELTHGPAGGWSFNLTAVVAAPGTGQLTATGALLSPSMAVAWTSKRVKTHAIDDCRGRLEVFAYVSPIVFEGGSAPGELGCEELSLVVTWEREDGSASAAQTVEQLVVLDEDDRLDPDDPCTSRY